MPISARSLWVMPEKTLPLTGMAVAVTTLVATPVAVVGTVAVVVAMAEVRLVWTVR